MIDFKGVTKEFGSFKAVDNISLSIEDGCFMGLLGPNGAGKTTLIKMLITLLKPTRGEIYIEENLVSRNNPSLKNKIGTVPQHNNLDRQLTTYENLVFAAKLFKMPKVQYEDRIEELLRFMDLESSRNKTPNELSGGMKRKLMLAKALVHNPDIIILDEPTTGVDITGRRKIWDILKAMKSQGKTILLTTHYIEEADYLCDKVCFIDEGKIFKNDKPNNLKEELGLITVEYFNSDLKTDYSFFPSREEAQKFTSQLKDVNYTVRETTLEDVFYNFTNRRVM